MRPAASTPVASIMTRPGPATASEPRCRMCQSVALPSIALYWHIGATTMRLGRVRPRNAIGVKSWLVIMFPAVMALDVLKSIGLGGASQYAGSATLPLAFARGHRRGGRLGA